MPPILTESIISDIKKYGLANFQSWLTEKGISLPLGNNFFVRLEQGLKEKVLDLTDVYEGLDELEENSNKLIRLYQTKDFKVISDNKTKMITHLNIKHSITLSTDHSKRIKAKPTPTFNYCFWDGNIIKIRYSEVHYDPEYDYNAGTISQKPTVVNIIIIIDCSDGLVQIRYDTPGKIHVHKNDRRTSSASRYEEYYKAQLFGLFPDITYTNYNLNKVINTIVEDKEIPYLINKDTTTVTDGVKRILVMPDFKADVRDNPEYINNEKFAEAWLNEDLSGFWLEVGAEKELRKDLFMRISRKNCELRVLRGCLAKELNYAITKIREIQNRI